MLPSYFNEKPHTPPPHPSRPNPLSVRVQKIRYTIVLKYKNPPLFRAIWDWKLGQIGPGFGQFLNLFVRKYGKNSPKLLQNTGVFFGGSAPVFDILFKRGNILCQISAVHVIFVFSFLLKTNTVPHTRWKCISKDELTNFFSRIKKEDERFFLNRNRKNKWLKSGDFFKKQGGLSNNSGKSPALRSFTPVTRKIPL